MPRPLPALLTLLVTLIVAPPPAARAGAPSAPDPTREAAFQRAAQAAEPAREALERAHRYLRAWLQHADPVSGLIPRNLTQSRDFWNGRDAAADNYAYMVLTAAVTDRPCFEGPMQDMLRSERRLTARVDRLADDYSFSTRTWRRKTFDLQATVFDSAEYAKDGLIPVTEWLGPSPWSRRLVDLTRDIWKHAAIPSPTSPRPLATLDAEVNGDLLQIGARLFWFTGDRRHLEWASRIGDHYLLGNQHPTRNASRLRLRDHGCEIVNGLTELYVALRHADPTRADRYREPLHAIFESILQHGRNEHGLLYDWFNPATGEHSPGLCDTWGYDFDGLYTLFLVDHIPAYRDAVRLALSNLHPHYRNHRWEGDSADGYADAIEGALNLLEREHVPSAADWIDSEIQMMWAKQQPDGIIEGWHGDGNFARTCLMYALWKSQGVTAHPWRPDLRLGATPLPDGSLALSVSLPPASTQPWTGRLHFDRPRHRDFLHLPLDYPRINQFPEWFTVEARQPYRIEASDASGPQSCRGSTLHRGWRIALNPGQELRLIVSPTAPHASASPTPAGTHPPTPAPLPPTTPTPHRMTEYEVLRAFPPGRLAALSAGDRPDANGLTGGNRTLGRWLEAGPQRGSCRAVVAAVAAGDLAAADDAWRGIDTAFAHQQPDGSFEATDRPNGKSARPLHAAVETSFFFLQELGRAILVIRQSPHEAHFKSRIDALEPRLRKACHFIQAGFDTIIPHHGHAVNRVLIAAKAFGTCGLVLHDESLVARSRELVRFALTRRDAQGVFSENGGRDSSYNAVSILFGGVLALHLPLPEFEAALPAAVAWQVSRVQDSGEVTVGGNTRTGVGLEPGYDGKPKNVNYNEVVLALTIHGIAHQDPAALAAAERAFHWATQARRSPPSP